MASTARNVRASNGRNGSKGAIHELTREEILELIDERARYLLGITGEEFMRRYEAGELEDAPAEAPLSVLADLVSR
ncbi:MAG: hypothetical protein ACRDH5_08745 [bacterium]